ncbi:hypothetical protein ACQP06_16560 [Nocardia sp. CA-136227]|uniref:hypothetical protein n=1 Tax=Nocardia sp. CA-136227 TaxID=3239979 RepID=UPI003D9666DB
MGIVEQVGACLFGVVMGWVLYYVNRHRDDKIGVRDIGTIAGAVGGSAVTALFPDGGRLFGWYCIGLATGFFAYLLLLLVLIWKSKGFTIEFLLDGRVPALMKKEKSSAQRPLSGGAPSDLKD